MKILIENGHLVVVVDFLGSLCCVDLCGDQPNGTAVGNNHETLLDLGRGRKVRRRVERDRIVAGIGRGSLPRLDLGRGQKVRRPD